MKEYKALIDKIYNLIIESRLASLRRQKEIIRSLEKIAESMPDPLRVFGLDEFLEGILKVMKFNYKLTRDKAGILEFLEVIGLPYDTLKEFLFNYSPIPYEPEYTQVISKIVVERNKKLCRKVFNQAIEEIVKLDPRFGKIILEFYEIFAPNAYASSNLNVVTVYLNLLAKAKLDYENFKFIFPEDIITEVIYHEVGHSMHQIVLGILEKLFRTGGHIVTDIFWEYVGERLGFYGLKKSGFNTTIKYHLIDRLNKIWDSIQNIGLILLDQEVTNYVEEFGIVDREYFRKMTFSDRLNGVIKNTVSLMKYLATLYAFLEKPDLRSIYREMRMGTIFTLLRKRSVEDVLKESLKEIKD